MAKRKRSKGEGTIYYSRARGRWVAQLPAGPDGRRTMKTADTEKEALKLLRQMQAERAAGRDATRQTVKELLDDWLATMKPVIRPGTYKSYETGCDHISSRIGRARAADVTTEQVQRLAAELGGAGLGPASVRLTLSRLHAAYDRLIPERFSYNPVNWRKLKLRRVERPDRRPLDAAQLRRLLLASADVEARGGNARWAAAVWLAGLLGMRRGEVFGLSWSDVDLIRAELRIRQQRARNAPGLLTAPKTNESRRTIPLGPRLAGLLAGLSELQQAERHIWGKEAQSGLVLAREDGSAPGIDLLARQLDLLAEQLGLPHLHPHLLRHTVASLLDELGYSETVIGAVLGHTPGKSTTRRYIHPRPEVVRRAVETLENEVFGPIAS